MTRGYLFCIFCPYGFCYWILVGQAGQRQPLVGLELQSMKNESATEGADKALEGPKCTKPWL